jgi:hypothetical protein
MPVNLIQNGPIPNIFQGSPNSLNKERKEAVYNVIGRLEYHQIFQNAAGTLVINDLMRVDMQGTFMQACQRFHNIQVQVNGVAGKSTVAHANVSESTMTDDPINQTGVRNRVSSALNQSFDSGHSYSVTGTAP